MGLYIRKAWSFGPFRINLSKGGLGFSFGFTGLRVGINRHGLYLHAGRGGVYYRSYLLGLAPQEIVNRDDD